MMNKKDNIVVIAGPTAVGKSALGIDLAKKLNGEIVSADSMQIYKAMDVGTAKVTEEEMEGIPHHLIDIVEPDVNFNVNDFKTGMTKWKDINLTETKNQYEFKDFTINALDGEESWSDMIMIFDPAKPDEIKIHSVSDETNFMSSNDQTYRRVK